MALCVLTCMKIWKNASTRLKAAALVKSTKYYSITYMISNGIWVMLCSPIKILDGVKKFFKKA